MSNYEKGANAEREAKRLLEMLGYGVLRAAGSIGEFDLIAVYSTHIRLVQVKSDTGKVTPEEREKIELYDVNYNWTTKEIWTRLPGKPAEERWVVEVVR